jgi:hypothetical protein
MLRRALKARFSETPITGIGPADVAAEAHGLQRKAAG